MHASEEGLGAVMLGDGTMTRTPIQNLLKMDCIACHANNPTAGQKKMTLPGGSVVPQVMHGDSTGDLAAGNFRYIAEFGNRKGHNVTDLVDAETDMSSPPGFRHVDAEIGAGGFDVEKFTCAGSMGCHGYRGQVVNSTTIQCDFLGYNTAYYPDLVACTAEELASSGVTTYNFRVGMSALSGFDGFPATSFKSGAHHQSYDGLKNDGFNPNYYDAPLANSYRFILMLRGYGNEIDRWENKDKDSHNEYIGGYDNTALGDIIKSTDFGTTSSCGRCHIGQNTVDSRVATPGATMSGFCVTCHGTFHSSGVTNGASGAFLRHPSDYVIPSEGEYANYNVYDVSAPVARPQSTFVLGMTQSAVVTPGQDLVMCLSCHMAHASPYDFMLRFDYQKMTAGFYDSGTDAQGVGGCLACHSEKGVLPENR
jgi:predicted CXXCH cytochrome family protein